MSTFLRSRLLARKEAADALRQPVFVVIGTLAPFLLFFVFYLIWLADVQVPIEVVNRAGAPGEPFIASMARIRTPAGTPYIRVERRDPAVLAERTPSQYLVMLEIPPEFAGHRRVVAHYGAEQENSVKNYINRLRRAATDYTSRQLGFEPIRLAEQPLYPRDIPTMQAMAVWLVAYACLLSAGIFGGVTVTREYEERTVKLIQVAPAPLALVLLPKGAVALGLTAATGAVYTGAVWLLTGAVPARPWLFLAAALTLALTGIALGMAAAILLRKSIPVFIALLVGNLSIWIASWAAGMAAAFSPLYLALLRLFPYVHGMNLFWHSYFGGKAASTAGSLTGAAVILGAALLAVGLCGQAILARGR